MENVFTNGNLREQMTMLYNGMFINGGKTKEEIDIEASKAPKFKPGKALKDEVNR